MAIKGFEKKDPMESLNQLMQLMNQMDAMGQRKIQRDKQDSINFQSRVNDIRTLDALTNILPSVNDHNQNLELSGNEKFNVIYSDKYNAYKNANSAYEKAKLIQDSNLENPDMLAKDLLKGGWEGAAAGIMDIDNLLDDIDKGDAYKFIYVGNEKYSQTGLKKALLTRRNAYTSVMELLDDPDNAESFLVVNPDGSMDEDTAALLDKLKFNIVTGDVQEVNATVKDGTTRAITDFNKYSNAYVKWNRLSNKILDGKTTVSDLGDDNNLNEMLLAYGLDESSPLDEEFINTMKATSLDLAKKANKRHKVFTGKLYNEDPFYKKYDEEEIFSDLDEMGMGEQKVVIDDINTDTGKDTEPPSEELSPVTQTTKVPTAKQSKAKPDVGSQRYKENEQANVRLNFVNSVLPEVTLKEKERGQTLSANWIGENEETMYNDVDKISNIIGGLSETFSYTDKNISSQQHKNVSDLYEKYLNKQQLIPLRRLIDKYNELGGREAKGTQKIRLAKKILTRYNTIQSKIKQKAKRF